MLKECKKHGLTEHSLRKGRINSYRCKKCQAAESNKRVRNVKILSVQYKGGKCQLCGYNKFIEALQFHHLNPEEKDFEFSKKGRKKKWGEEIMKELDKCICVCANCHAEIHAGYVKLIEEEENK